MTTLYLLTASNVEVILGAPPRKRVGRMMSKADGLIFHEVRVSYDGPREFAFARDIRFDEDNVFSNGDKVTLVADGHTLFTGWILDNDPSLSDNERIEYRAVGPRAKLSGIIHTKDGSADVVYNAENKRETSTSGWTYAQIFEEIVAGVSNEYIASTSGIHLLSDVAPEITFAGMSVDDCLRYIVEKAGKFGFYITPSRELRVVDLSNTIDKNVYVGEVGQRVGDHSEYDVARAMLNWSVSGCKTSCVIEGSRERTEGYINLVPNWNKALEKDWTWYVSKIPQDIINSMYDGDEIEAYNQMHKVFREYKISGVSLKRVWNRLISDPDKRPYTEFMANNGEDWIYFQGVIDLMTGIVLFPHALYQKRTKHAGTPAETTVRYGRDARLYCVIETDPVKVTVGPVGTAYDKGVKNVLYILDESLVKENVAREGEETVRDDTSKMQTMADSLLDGVKDETVTGTVSLDGLDYGWTLENNANLQNAYEGKWSSLSAILLGITYRFEHPEQTELRFSNSQYLGAGPEYSELKWRLMVGQRIRELEEDVNELRFIGGSTIGGGDTDGRIPVSPDDDPDVEPEDPWEEPDEDQVRTVEEVRQVVQDAMDEAYFDMQNHDHVGDPAGGPAFAERGARLL